MMPASPGSHPIPRSVTLGSLVNMHRISVAIPLHDEELVFPELIRRVTAALDDLLGGPHEILLVDDGSETVRSS